MRRRLRLAARGTRDAWREAFVWRDRGAALTALANAWAALKGDVRWPD